MARKESDFRKVKDMLLDFAESIDFDLDYQSFLMELSMHETHFSPPSGASFMLITDGRVRGCICTYGIRPGIAELKRFFIYPDSATPKNMRMMLDVAIDWARQSGFRKIKLDPANSMNAAINITRSRGFSTSVTRMIPVTSAESVSLNYRLAMLPKDITEAAWNILSQVLPHFPDDKRRWVTTAPPTVRS